MARYRHGGRPSDFTISDPTLTGGTVTISANAPGTFWSAASGGTQYSDLQTLAGAPTTSISSDTKGQVVPFLGPDEVRGGWADFGGGRFWLDPVGPTPPASATAVGGIQLAGDLSGTAAAPTVPALTGKVAKGDLVLNAKDYGLKGDGTVESTTSLYAAINGATGAVRVYFPRCAQYYNITTPLPSRSYTTYMGDGPGAGGSRIRATVGSVLAPTTSVIKMHFRDLLMETNAGHIIDLGTTGALAQCTFTRCEMVTYVNGSSLVSGSGTCGWQEVVMDQCEFTRPSTATVPAFNLSGSGGGFNMNIWRDCRANSGNGGSTYFWRINETGSAAYDNKFEGITCEQCPSGILWITSPNGLTLDTVVDYDTTGAYTSSLVKVDKSTGSYPGNLKMTNVGNRTPATLGTGVYHVEIIPATYSPTILDRIGTHLGAQKVSVNAYYGATYLDASGAAGALATQTVSYTFNDTSDGTVVFNGASLTATLPDPTTVRIGRRFSAKNINATALTVVSAGTSKTIDGAASVSLAQWARGTYVSDGTQWLTV